MQKSIGSADHQRLGRRLRELREAAGFSQAALAELLDVNQTFVSKVERGERRLDVLELREVCHVLGIRLGALIAEFE